MNKLYFILTIAENGLRTGAKLLSLQAKSQTDAANAEPDPAKKAALLAKAQNSAKLAKVLSAADAGILEYLTAE